MTLQENRLDLPGWLSLSSAVVLGLGLASRRIWAADFWWQLATGRYVAEQGWPHGDPFSFTAEAAPWIELRWLFCWLQFRLMEAVGPTGPSLLKIALIAIAFIAVSVPVVHRRNRVWAGIVLAIALHAASPRFFVRPEWVTLALFGFFVLVLDRYRRNGSRWIWLLPVLQLLWVNSHPLFVFGPLLCGLAAVALAFDAGAGRYGLSPTNLWVRMRSLLLALAACVAASFANPYGIVGAKLPFLLFSEVRESVFQQVITELQSPFGGGAGLGTLVSFKGLLALAALSTLMNVRRLDPFWTILAASQLYLASLSVRSIPLFCIAAVPLIIFNMDRQRWTRSANASSWYPKFRTAAAGLLVLICLQQVWELATNRFYVRRNDSNQFGWGLAEDRYPIEATAALHRESGGDRILAGLAEGSYLLAHGKKVFADPRLEVYGETIFREYLAAMTDRTAMDQAIRKYKIDGAMLEPGSPAVSILSARPDWGQIYLDSVAAIFVPRTEANSESARTATPALDARALAARERFLLEALRARPAWQDVSLFGRVHSPKPALTLADFCFRIQDVTCAAEFLDEAERISPFVTGLEDKRAALQALASRSPRSSAAEQQIDLAMDRLQAGDPVRAEELAREVTVNHPDQPAAWALLGRLLADRGRLPQAADAFSRAVQLQPDQSLYRVALARIVAALGYPEQAIEGMRIALDLDPENVEIMRGLAALSLTTGDVATTRQMLERGLALRPQDAGLLEIRDALASRN